jgi:hypothetical protein
LRLVGILLIVFGVLVLAYGGIRYTTREKVLDIGPLQATTERHHVIPLSPVIGIASIVGGIAVVVTSPKTRT